jgi:proliferating cell nuclear antigen PCNA
MDNSHVALVSVHLKEEAFTKFRCDHPMPLGVNLTSLTKVLKCAKDDDKVTLKASDDADTLNLTYEAPSKSCYNSIDVYWVLRAYKLPHKCRNAGFLHSWGSKLKYILFRL